MKLSEKRFLFRLYYAGETPEMLELANELNLKLNQFLRGRFNFEKINVLYNPDQAIRDDVYVTPTFIRVFPHPSKRMFGDASVGRKILKEIEMVFLP